MNFISYQKSNFVSHSTRAETHDFVKLNHKNVYYGCFRFFFRHLKNKSFPVSYQDLLLNNTKRTPTRIINNNIDKLNNISEP